LRRKVIIIGITLTILAYAILMAFDTQLRFLIFGSPMAGGQLPFGEGMENWAALREQGAPAGFTARGEGLFSVTGYLRLSGYLIGLAGVVLTSLGILLEPKTRPKSEGGDADASGGSLEEQPVRATEASPVKSSGECKRVSGRGDLQGQRKDNAIIKLESVAKTYGVDGVPTQALNGVSLEICEGEFVSIVGPSGSGKSTLLNVMGALDKPTSGKVFVDGVDISKLDDGGLANLRNRKIGFVFQSFNLIHRMTALANVEFPLTARDIPPQQRRQMAQKALQLVGLGNKTGRIPSQLSGGEVQRVAVARALVTEPAIILADEPTGNLDTKNAKVITEMIKHINETTGRTIIQITHNMKLARAAERIIYLRDGMVEREEFPIVNGAA
jgi:putative ABC transport system ATP-binding protein